MLIREDETKDSTLLNVVQKMMLAARTAPKGRGRDNLFLAIADAEEIKKISAKMEEIGVRNGADFFLRDAKNILLSPYMLIVGTRIKPADLAHCGHCGHGNCDGKRQFPDAPCAFNTNDMGIAIGSAVSVAANHRVDNRVMFSAGKAVKELNLMGDEVKIIYCIPVTATSKSPFFDRG